MAIWFPGRRIRRIQQEAAHWRAEMLEPYSPELRAQFEAWRAKDPEHARAYEEIDRISTLSERLPGPERRRQRSSIGGPRLRPAFGVALVTAIAATGVLLVTSQETPVPYSAVTNSGPAIRLFRLSDGSTITLDIDTELDVAMTSASREVRLRSGRARFKIVEDTARPFTVAAGGGRVLANGSEFDVATDGDRTTVMPLKGEVQVSPTEAGEPEYMPVAPGIAARIEGAAVTATPVSRQDRLWPAGRLSFDNAPLEKIVAMANRLGGPPIRLGSEGIGTLGVTAVLNLRDTHALARKLAAALDLDVEETGGEVILTR